MPVQESRSFPPDHETFDVAGAFAQEERLWASGSTLVTFLDKAGDIRPVVNQAVLMNGAATAATMGIGPDIRFARWNAGTWTDSAAGNDYVDDTVDAQDAGAGDYPLTTNTDNDGHVVLCRDIFSCISYIVSQAAAGGSPVYEWRYWNGSAWTNIGVRYNTPTFTPAGTMNLIFTPPSAWTRSTVPSPGEGIPAGYYAVRVRATTAPTITPALATNIRVAHPLALRAVVGAAAQVILNGRFKLCEVGDGLVGCTQTAPTAESTLFVAGERFTL